MHPVLQKFKVVIVKFAQQVDETMNLSTGCDIYGITGVDCQWNCWETWSACSVTCGLGQQTRSRTIDHLAKNNGKTCNAESSIQYQTCNISKFHIT